MENLRWILIIAGVAILALLWFSGRSGRREAEAARAVDPLFGNDRLENGLDDGLREVPLRDGYDDFADVDPEDLARPGETPSTRAPAIGAASGDAAALGLESPAAGGHVLGGLAQKFEAIGERLAPKRRQRVAASEPRETDGEGRPTKIVTLHVVAPRGEILPPEALHALFERRGYHHGDMSIYHSMYRERAVFSVARMINPGTFDPDDLATFETPGLAMILQLPAPVAADTAFEVMLSEAFDIAEELGATVLDGNRSTLGRQTVQHMRESIYEYMHRQKYLDGVPS